MSAGVRRVTVASSRGDRRPATSSTACRTPRRSRATATPLPNAPVLNVMVAGASRRTVSGFTRGLPAITSSVAIRSVFAVAFSVAVAATCALVPRTTVAATVSAVTSAVVLSASASCRPIAVSRADPATPAAAMPSATSEAFTSGAFSGSITRAFSTRCPARLPVLMTLPMIMFILPCVFLVVAGPAILSVIEQMSR